MGLKEHLQAGAVLDRKAVPLAVDPVLGSGSIEIGSAYLLYTIQTDTGCRLRLYDNSSSLNDVTEQARVFGDTNIPDSIALISDYTMSAGIFTVDPVVYGVCESPVDRLTYYKIDNASTPPNIVFNRYLLEDSTVDTDSRVILPPIQHELFPGQLASSSLFDLNMPRTYLFVSASVSNTSAPIRVRMYNTRGILTSSVEKMRPYGTEALTTTLLIDAVLTGSQTTYFVPKIIGANLQNMGSDITRIRNNFGALAGKNEMYYIVENLAPVGPTASVTASFHVFSLED